jgi:hypothetical protein
MNLLVSDTTRITLFLLVLSLLAAVWLWLPRAVPPSELTALRLDRRQVEQVIHQDTAAAKRGHTSKEADLIRKLMLEKGESEREAREPWEVFQRRRRSFALAVAKIREKSGDQTLIDLRAQAVERLEKALALELPKAESQRVLGAFPVYLERYGAVRDGDIVAPQFVIRTMYKSRWNLTVGLKTTAFFAPVERLAHFGWLVRHADNAPIQLRIRALPQYAQAGGQSIEEASGVLYFFARNYPEAIRYLTLAYQRNSSIRLRNYLLGARKAADNRD